MPSPVLLLAILFLPLGGFLCMGLFGKRWLRQLSGPIGTLLMAIACAIAIWVAAQYFFGFGRTGGVYQKLVPWQFDWLPFFNGLSIRMGILLDPISMMMIVVVTFISLLVHVFSLEYMKGEERYPVYFAYLSLFSFSMLGLVLASNIFQTYIFWELVGVSSYLLIGFYYDRPAAVAASKKAFIVTRFADLGFLIGILILSYYSGSFDFDQLIGRMSDPSSNAWQSAVKSGFLGCSALSWALVLVFLGGAGKSAMFPLHVWLPDAMEGPTPVSALIHAATMVVAGVYLVARLFPIYAFSPAPVLDLVAWVGVLSSLLAALVACTQTDIKRVLAYSTISQIGFMMFAIGCAGYGGEARLGFTASMAHLFTHAMFKALLFLGAGAIIHYVHSNEMKDMGGLRKAMPLTHICFLVACLAISGVPPFSGFFTKEEILLAAHNHNRWIFGIGLLTSGLTAFYMFRLYFRIFWYRSPTQPHGSHGEGGVPMLAPLVILALAATFTGFLPFGQWISPDGKPIELSFHFGFSILPIALALTGILTAAAFFLKTGRNTARLTGSWLYRFAANKFYIDQVYLFVTKKIIFRMVAGPAAWIDRNLVDGMVNASADATEFIAEKIKKIQSGKVQQYAMYFLIAAVGLALLLMARQ